MFFPTLDAATGQLAELALVPMRMRGFRLNRASGEEADWLAAALREAGRLPVERAADGALSNEPRPHPRRRAPSLAIARRPIVPAPTRSRRSPTAIARARGRCPQCRCRHRAAARRPRTPTHHPALLAEAARAGAQRVTAVVPYFAYARQDVRKHPGEPRSAQLAARILAAAGIERVIALELHSPALESAFPMPVVHLRADELLIPIARSRGYVIVSPDAGGMKRAQRYAGALGAPLAVVAKARTGPDVAAPLQVLGDVRGQACLVVDDMASTGRTLAGAAQALLAAGAREVHAMFVHAVMSPGARERIRAAGVRSIVTTDSVRAVAEPGVQVVSTAPLFVRAL
jgi:ribose-phosphate pyrophosphokinase